MRKPLYRSLIFLVCIVVLAGAIFDESKVFAEGNSSIVFWRSREPTKKIALTFDDGPHPRYTERILEILERYDIKATFFVVGKDDEESEEKSSKKSCKRSYKGCRKRRRSRSWRKSN